MVDRGFVGQVFRGSQSVVVRREDLIKLFSISELFTEIGNRVQKNMDAYDEEGSKWPLGKLIELRSVAED